MSKKYQNKSINNGIRGFTLVELLGIIVIISALIAIVYPSVLNILKQGKDTVHDVQINKILNSAYDYTLKNPSMLPEKNKVIYMTLNELKLLGLIDNDITDSNTNKPFSNDLVISVKNVGSNYKNILENSKLRGNYLYTVETSFMDDPDYQSKRPEIIFEGYNTNPIVINLNIGDKYVPLSYSAVSHDGKDLTEYVVANIVNNSINVKNINTSSAGIYYINYSVVDFDGYSNFKVINIIISDTKKPILVVAENETISISETSYDLMSGASCTDNSGVCDISIVGSIEFGSIGKYVIEYTAVDPSGNTTISKRVITVE